MKENRQNDQPAKGLESAEVISSLYWKVGADSNIGSRSQQQDSYGVVLGDLKDRPALLAVLADGMGGMKNGKEFSQMAVDFHISHFQETLDRLSDPRLILLSLALRANEETAKIYDEEEPGGTTLVTALFVGDRFYTLSIGDSRICLFRKNVRLNRYVPLQLNREHVLGASLDERAWMGQIAFEDAAENMYRDSLTSAVGGSNIRRIDLPEGSTRFIGGDKLALMSDGIYRSMTEAELAEEMDLRPNEATSRIVGRVVEKKLPHQDNMTIVVVERI